MRTRIYWYSLPLTRWAETQENRELSPRQLGRTLRDERPDRNPSRQRYRDEITPNRGFVPYEMS